MGSPERVRGRWQELGLSWLRSVKLPHETSVSLSVKWAAQDS